MIEDKAQTMTRIYRFVWWMRLYNTFIGSIHVILAVILVLIIWTSIIGIQFASDVDVNTNAFIVVLRILLTGSALSLATRGIIYIGQGLLSYLKTSPEGLEYRVWPFYTLRCRWEDVDRQVKLPKLFVTELRLKEGEQSGPKWILRSALWFRRLFRMGSELAIPLNSFEGWKNGALAEDLRKNAPHAFEASVDV